MTEREPRPPDLYRVKVAVRQPSLILKGLITGGTGRTAILGAICYQIATKTWQVGSGLNRGGSAPSLSHFQARVGTI
jgi:hypothetical protein